ncbi:MULTISPECIES: FAD-dependent oxidoreductase [unclassified Streptomyces]|uniref:NAD(P)/FAD-dependent oxidoreductase n=1 Tax=unclassified Streptomyces TaxID=2593676 RepID=UPI002DD9D199|nr:MULTISPECIES: FAD-dependent oxidoreductase [unclassified Streptomyces]WSA90671.1 FAD-binding oxidoreductase [Streptomyces sp. NBC_01795]WSB74996.1 FAD-binding oxidoreductase [Streptomyces sp. NBC_01775]WSS16725.1 FAD-binding oxidoreductase [Streptomyces sp. NBC_01186]WSS45543.1 FAD-binding oxidoreductase [Streptomyces sp. NBC_01187]
MNTTRTAPEHVAVVGAGMAGLSTAWFLQERGVRVTVLDRTGVAAGSSWGNAGMLNPAFTVPLPEPSVLRYGFRSFLDRSSPVSIPPAIDRQLWSFLLSFARNCTARQWQRTMTVFNELNRACLAAYEQLAEGGVSAPVKSADPLVIACRNRQDREHILEEFAHMSASGGDEARYETVTGGELRELEPVLSAEVRTGLRVYGQRFINPPEFMRTLAEDIRDRGGEIVEDFSVARVHDLGETGVELVPSATSKATDTVRADAVVLAGGAWLNDLAQPFGVRMRVQAGRGYSFTVRPRVMPTHPIYLSGQRIACNPLGDRFRVTGSMEFRAPDAPLDPRRIRTIIESARPMFSGIDWNDRHEEWVGSRPCTADGLPLVGPSRSPRVQIAGGHGMWGMVLGPLTGRLLADAMTGNGEVPPLLRHLDPLR